MKKRGLFRYILPLLLLTHSNAFAADKGFYFIGRKSAGFYDILNKKEVLLLQPKQVEPKNNEQQLISAKQYTSSHEDSDSEDSDSDDDASIHEATKHQFTISDQILNILNRAKGYEKPNFRTKLQERVFWDIVSPAPFYGFCEAGLGYYCQLVLPFAIELKALSEHKQISRNVTFFFFASNCKVFLPLGDLTKLYFKIGKIFPLHVAKPSNSILWPHKEARDDIINHCKKKSWKDHLELSRTFVGAGIIRKISSRIEIDLSCEGYALNDCGVFCYTFSVGVNYLF